MTIEAVGAHGGVSRGDGGLGGLLDRIEEGAAGERVMTLGDLQAVIGRRGFGPFLVVPALFEISPIGGIPGVPTFFATIIALAAVQMLFGRTSFWLPEFLRARRVRTHRLDRAVGWLRPVARVADRVFRERLPALTGEPFIRVIALICLALAFTVPPLEIVPFLSSAPMAAIALFGLALIAHDGLVALAAMALSGIAVGAVFLVVA